MVPVSFPPALYVTVPSSISAVPCADSDSPTTVQLSSLSSYSTASPVSETLMVISSPSARSAPRVNSNVWFWPSSPAVTFSAEGSRMTPVLSKDVSLVWPFSPSA